MGKNVTPSLEGGGHEVIVPAAVRIGRCATGHRDGEAHVIPDAEQRRGFGGDGLVALERFWSGRAYGRSHDNCDRREDHNEAVRTYADV